MDLSEWFNTASGQDWLRQDNLRREVWEKHFAKFVAKQRVGEVVEADQLAHIVRDVFNDKEEFFVRAFCIGEYPEEPKIVLRDWVPNCRALRMFLTDTSRFELKSRFPDLEGDLVKVRAVKIVGYSKKGNAAFCEVLRW